MFTEVVSITAVKKETNAVFDELRKGEKVFFIARNSKAEVVMLSVKNYQNLISRLESMEDALEFKKAKKEYKSDNPVDYNEYRNKRLSNS